MYSNLVNVIENRFQKDPLTFKKLFSRNSSITLKLYMIRFNHFQKDPSTFKKLFSCNFDMTHKIRFGKFLNFFILVTK